MALGEPTAVDNSGEPPELRRTAQLTGGAAVTLAKTLGDTPFPIGETIVSFVATDGAGNSGECRSSVTVRDEEAPALACPADLTVKARAGEDSAEATLPTPEAGDNSGGTVALTASVSGAWAGEPRELEVDAPPKKWPIGKI